MTETYTSKTRDELLAICKEQNIRGYSNKPKNILVKLLQDSRKPDISPTLENTLQTQLQNKENKKTRGQFYTVNNSYILDGLSGPPPETRCIIEPFAGRGDLLDWVEKQGLLSPDNITTLPIEAYDIEPKKEGIVLRDTLANPPDYTDAWIITNAPYLARNKCNTKDIFDKYNTNDLYKCFIASLTRQPKQCAGGIFILPAGFFLSPRDLDVRCRNDFLSKYRLLTVK